jgi:ABC-type Mn2+/Zn2+ transport system ATPase subunit
MSAASQLNVASEFAVELHGLTRRFGNFVAVDGVTLKIPKGRLYGFLGLNGAGKTTTIRMLTTLLPPSAGSAKLWGHDVVKEPLAVRSMVGLVSDETSESQSTWTAREYLAYFARLRNIPDAGDHVERLLDDVGLDGAFRGKLIGTYSTGMNRRVEIARALMGKPKVLFLDEPTRTTASPSAKPATPMCPWPSTISVISRLASAPRKARSANWTKTPSPITSRNPWAWWGKSFPGTFRC